jgi:transglutaminase-like putative cysteine protease
MKVRAAQAAFWRAQAYDTFDGRSWTATDAGQDSLYGGFGGPPIDVPRPPEAPLQVPSRELTQTFYVQTATPNVIFAAYRPTSVYFPVDRIAIDTYTSIRSPVEIEAGTIYSVVSDLPAPSVQLLRMAGPIWPPETIREYTQLPSELPQRDVDLAHRITDGAPTLYDKVMAVQAWLQRNTRYNLDVPRDPPGADPVDYFLFERRQGYCEHIASAMAVLLRAVGIPTRLGVGFDPGERNLLTGYFEVRESDAHAWVEVLYPGVGWIEYDPTHDVPQASPSLASRFLAPHIVAAVGRALWRLVRGPVAAILGPARSAAGWALRALGAVPLVLGVVGLVGVGVAALFRRRRRGRRRRETALGAAGAFASLCETFEARGLARPPARTPSEHLARVLASDELARAAPEDVTLIVRTFERQAFSASLPGSDEVGAAIAAAHRLRDRANRRRVGSGASSSPDGAWTSAARR